MSSTPIDDIAKKDGFENEDYAYGLLKDGVRDEHVVNSLITLKKMERKAAERLVDMLSRKVAAEKQNKWAIISGVFFIVFGLLRLGVFRSGRSAIFIIIGVVTLLGGLLRRYK